MRRDLGAVEGLGSGRDQRWRSWTTDSNGGSTERKLSRTAPIQGKHTHVRSNFEFKCNQTCRILANGSRSHVLTNSFFTYPEKQLNSKNIQSIEELKIEIFSPSILNF